MFKQLTYFKLLATEVTLLFLICLYYHKPSTCRCISLGRNVR